MGVLWHPEKLDSHKNLGPRLFEMRSNLFSGAIRTDGTGWVKLPSLIEEPGQDDDDGCWLKITRVVGPLFSEIVRKC